MNQKYQDRLVPFRSILKLEAKRASVYTLSTFIKQFGSFLIVPLFWQKLSPADYGTIAVTEIIGSFTSMFLGLSLETSITRFYYEWPQQERKRRVGAIWMVNWLSSILLGAILIYVLPFVSHILFPEVAFYPFVFLGLIGTVLASLTRVPSVTIRIKNLPFFYAAYSITIFVIQLASKIYLILFLGKGLQGFYIANIISGGIIAMAAGVIMFVFATPSIRGTGLREVFKFSLPFIPTNMISSASSLMDRFILQQFTSLEVLGIYAISLKFAKLVGSMHGALKMSYIPFVYETIGKSRDKGIHNIARMRMFYLLPILMVGMTISAYIMDFVRIVNNPEYLPVVQWVPWLVGVAILATFNVYFTPGIRIAKRTDLMWVPAVVQLIAILLGGLLLIPKYQLIGVVVSRYVSIISFLAVAYALSERYYPIPINRAQVCLLLVCTALGIGVTSSLTIDHLITSIVVKTILVAVFSFVFLVVVVGLPQSKHILKEYLSRIVQHIA